MALFFLRVQVGGSVARKAGVDKPLALDTRHLYHRRDRCRETASGRACFLLMVRGRTVVAGPGVLRA